MAMIADILSWLCILAGGFFCVVGAVGLIKLPDVFSRMHGAGLIDTLGVGLVILGLAFQAGFTLVLAKLGMIVLFILLTGPTASHALSRAALSGGVQPETVDGSKAEFDLPEAQEDGGAEPSKT